MSVKLTGKDSLLEYYRFDCNATAWISLISAFVFVIWPSMIDSKEFLSYCILVAGWSIPRFIFGVFMSCSPLFDEDAELAKISSGFFFRLPVALSAVGLMEVLFGVFLFASHCVTSEEFGSSSFALAAAMLQFVLDMCIARVTFTISHVYLTTPKGEKEEDV